MMMNMLNASDIISSATKPIDPHIKWDLNPRVFPNRELYICEGMPRAIVRESIVLDSYYPSLVTNAYVPEVVYEFDFWNEYEGYLKANKLNPVKIDYSTIDTCAYIVDIESMILYRYKPFRVASIETSELKNGKFVKTKRSC